jgi:hypothetical protein
MLRPRHCSVQVPFWGPTEAAIFKQVQRGQLDLTRNACKQLTRESKELMLSMLNRDPGVRTCHIQRFKAMCPAAISTCLQCVAT